jgi:integrase
MREPGGRTDKEARKKLKHRLNEVANHTTGLRHFQGPRQERLTVEDLLHALEREYDIHGRKSLPQLRSHLRHIRRFFSMDRALSVTTDRLRDYIAARQRDGAAPASINRGLEGLQRAFALAVEGGLLSFAPRVPSLQERNARQGFFERADFEAIMGRLGDADLRDFCEWLYRTGMRPGEIRSLEWPTLDRETWTLRLHAKDAKTGYGRVIPIEGELRALMERRLKARRLDCRLIFHRSGKPVRDFRKVWKRACKEAGQQGKIPYDCRRTAVRNMVRAGVDPAVAMKISGHRTRNIFDRYNIISETDLRDALAKTDAYVASLPGISNVVPLRQEAIGR